MAQSHLETLPRGIQAALPGLVALAAFPFVGSEFYQQMVAKMMILAIFAMSLDLLQGVTGLVSLGHAAFFGLGGYALALLSSDAGPISLWWLLPAAMAVAALAALVIGFFVVRTRGIYHHGDDGVRPDAVLPGVRQQGTEAVRRLRPLLGRLRRRLHQL